MDFHIIFCDILNMITVDQIHICLIISPLAAKLKAYHRSITVNAQSAQVIYTAPVIGIKTGAVSHIEIHVSRCTRRNRKLIRGRIILLVLLWERTQIIIDRCLMLCQQRGITLQKEIPLTGVTLPLVSAGGSSIVGTMASLGLLIGISSLNAEAEAVDLRRMEWREGGGL